LFPFVSATSANTAGFTIHVDEADFLFTPPTGFKALNTANLPAPTVTRPQNAIVALTGIDSTVEGLIATARTGWTDYIDIYKNRDVSESWHVRFSDDSGNYMAFDDTSVKKTNVSLGIAADAYVAYSMRVGASYGLYTAEVSHTGGASTQQAHSLTSDGSFMGVVKRSADGASSGGSWYVDHTDLTAGYNMLFDSNAAEQNTTVYCAVDATYITIDGAAPTGTYRVIVWAEKRGLISMQGYTGNNSTNGPFVYHGGRPLFSLVKRTTAGGWRVGDRAREPGNPLSGRLDFQLPDAETTILHSDFLATGYKLRTVDTSHNASGIIYTTLCYLDAAVGGTGLAEGTAV
tara:strand:- start:5161 stop:6198 length:1038 start_codon:yes stop_codon:yes gene_type:complete